MANKIDRLLALGRKNECSDIHFTSRQPIMIRVLGRLKRLEEGPEPGELRRMLLEILSDEQRQRFERGADLDFAYESESLGRFRVNLFRKVGGMGASFRAIPLQVRTLADLGMPPAVENLAFERQGMVLVTGAAGTGKTTTLAAMVHSLNLSRRLTIITLEDPIEYVHKSAEALIVQREVGTHVRSFADGLKSALREDPDVILVGELRDPESITLAMTAAETGHLVLGTLHTTSATKTIDRIIDAVPNRIKGQAAIFLSQHLRGVISQRLLLTADGQGRKAIVEILINTPAIRNLIKNRKIFQIPDKLQTGKQHGMQLMDQALLVAVKNKEVDPNEAYIGSTNKQLFQRYVTDSTLLPKVSLMGG